jgi:3-hydroxyisobutyrate dehydrogenase-like beta-hydroxyacid dehydrogenase
METWTDGIGHRRTFAGRGAVLRLFDPNKAAPEPFVAKGAMALDVAAGTAVRIYEEVSTIGGPAQAKVQKIIEARDIALLDCPISGGPKGVRAGTLTVITTGPPEVRTAVRPRLQAIGQNIFEVGDKPGQAQLMKLVNNLVNAANMATAFEALVLGAKGGLDPDQMVNVLNVSTGQNSATLTKAPTAVLTGTFDYGSSLTIMVKDVVLGLKEAEVLGVPMWVHEAVGLLWRFGEQQGLGPADFTSLIKVLEGWADVKVRSRREEP